MQISIILLTWNSDRYLGGCLDSLIETVNSDRNDCEIFIVDNGSTDQTVNQITRYQKRYPSLIKPILLGINTGTTYSRNLALKQATGTYVVVMDSDIEVNRLTLRKLIDAIESNKDIGLVAPKLVYGSGKLQKSTDQFPTLTHKIYRYFFLKKMESRDNKKELKNSKKVDYAISAFWLFRQQLLNEIGYLDEKFFYAPEDADFCLRIWKHGQSVLYIPDSQATHYAQELSRGLVFNKALAEHLRGMAYFFTKHRYVFRKPIFAAKKMVS